MKNQKKPLVSKTFVIVPVSVLLYLVVTNFIIAYFMGFGAMHDMGWIFRYLSLKPTAFNTTSYYNADFGVILNPAGSFTSGNVLFYRLNTSSASEDDAVQCIYRIWHSGGGTGRPSIIDKKYLYFPHFAVLHGKNPHHITILKDGHIYDGHIYERDVGGPNGEFITEINNKIFIDVNGFVNVYDRKMNLIKRIKDPAGRHFFHIYKYNNKLYAVETSLNDTILVEINPDTLQIDKETKYPFAILTDGDHTAAVHFKGKVYASGFDGPLKKGIPLHRVIYELTDAIKPVYIFPHQVEFHNSIEEANKKILYSEDPNVSFVFKCFAPIDPEKGSFVLFGRTGILARKVHSFLYFTDRKKFVEVPQDLMKGDDLYLSTGVYIKGNVYFATSHNLIAYTNGKFKLLQTFSSSPLIDYDATVFVLNRFGK
jgi:hypothetical protein